MGKTPFIKIIFILSHIFLKGNGGKAFRGLSAPRHEGRKDPRWGRTPRRWNQLPNCGENERKAEQTTAKSGIYDFFDKKQKNKNMF
jgi:hypothetical protein